MLIAITTISILAITGVIWLLNRILPLRLRSGPAFRICPICVGVSGTWLWMLVMKFLGYEIDLIIPAMLIGGSVVGIAYQIEKRPAFANASAGKLLLWKTLFIPAGFIAVYSAISSWWTVFFAITTLLIILTLKFTDESRVRVTKSDKTARHEQSRRVEDLENKMENCC